MIDGADKRAYAAAFHAEIAEIFLGLGFTQIDQLALDLGADYDGFRSEMVAGVFLDGAHVLPRGIGRDLL